MRVDVPEALLLGRRVGQHDCASLANWDGSAVDGACAEAARAARIHFEVGASVTRRDRPGCLKAGSLARAIVEEVKPLASLNAAPILLSMNWLPLFSAFPVALVGSENARPPHRKLPKIELSLTVQSVVPNRITPAPIG